MTSDKKGKAGDLLASNDQIVIKQQQTAPTRYRGALAPDNDIVIKQSKDAKDRRY